MKAHELTRDLSAHIAKLSGLILTEEELEAMTRDLGAIVAYMEVLDTLDTQGVEAMPHILPTTNVLREDSCADSADRAALLQNAAAQQDGYVCVPRTVEGGDA